MAQYGYAKRKYSWKTTTAGVVSLLVLILGAIHAMIDDDPATSPDLNSIGVAALAVGAMFARDNNVSSEEAGAK